MNTYIISGPGLTVKIIDENKNFEWDTGNYLKKIQPEKVIYLTNELDLRANWELNESIEIK